MVSGPLTAHLYLPVTFHDARPPSSRIGVAFTYHHEANSLYENDLQPFNVSWYYNYLIDPPPNVNSAAFVPMLWCRCADDNPPAQCPRFGRTTPLNDVQITVAELGSDYAGYLLFLNEPDNFNPSTNQGLQCNGSIRNVLGGNVLEIDVVEYSVDIYEQLIDPVNGLPNAKIIGPNITQGGALPRGYLGGKSWLEAWIEEVLSRGLPLPHGYGFHSYRSGDPTGSNPGFIEGAQLTFNDLDQFHNVIVALDPNAANKEIWLTEFGFDRNTTRHVKKCDGVTPSYNSDRDANIRTQLELLLQGLHSPAFNYITRHAAFATRSCRLFSDLDLPVVIGDWTADTDIYQYGTNQLSPIGEVFQEFSNNYP